MKKIISSILALCLITSGTLLSANAATAVKNEDSPVSYSVNIDEPTPEMMEQMIKKVRPLITVPENYKTFNWDFRSGTAYSEAYWSFFWSDDTTGEISVICDTEGRITGFDVYSYSSNRDAVLPSVSPEELIPVAKDFIKVTAPYLDGFDLRLTETSYPSVFYNHYYTYTFTRYENDIEVPENLLRISVNHLTKQVESMSVSMNLDVDFSIKNNLISADKAKEILGTKQSMNLSYKLKTEYDEDGILLDRKAYLVYTPAISYISVDAEKGEIYTERNTWNKRNTITTNGALGGVLMDSMAKEETSETEDGEYKLTEEELAQLEVLAGLISKDEATKVILEDSDLYLPENAYLSDARLTKRYTEPRPLYAIEKDNGETKDETEKYVWNLYFSTPGEMYLGASATIDAKDSSLLSFNSDLPYTYHYEEFSIAEPEITLDKNKAVEIALGFIQKHQPEKAKNIHHSNSSDYSVIRYDIGENKESIPVYRASRINFVRVNEGIDFTYNSFNMGVDRATGKITRYSYSWYDDITFESPKDAISKEEALTALYSDQNGFGINYEINSNYTYIDGKYNSVESDVYSRAVYSLYSPLTTTVRAIDGALIDYSGEQIDFEENISFYTDMENHWAKETATRFYNIGFSFGSDKFEPNKAITAKEFYNVCEFIRIYSNKDDDVKSESITRMDAVKIIIDHLGYGKIALLENVFITDFADNSDFKANDIGYAAIARGFGLIEGDGENFRPYDTLTRAEALTIIENVIDLGILNS